MGICFRSGEVIELIYQRCNNESTETTHLHSSSNLGRGVRALDYLISITAIVLGVLAFLKILPLPPGMSEPFAYAAVATGILNFLMTLFEKLRRCSGNGSVFRC